MRTTASLFLRSGVRPRLTPGARRLQNFGNSGGGVFHGDTLELVGIFAKIYTHGSYRPQVITHMGLAVPLDRLHSWLSEVGYEHLLPQN